MCCILVAMVAERHSQLRHLAGWLLLALFVAAASLGPLPAWGAVLDVGNEGRFVAPGETDTVQNFFGVHLVERARDGSERDFRWTSAPRVTLTFPAAQRMQPQILTVSSVWVSLRRQHGHPHHLRQRPTTADQYHHRPVATV
ncbi:MAG: hypothetical protein HC893_06650 [Chloroflexaceae bacterium]|nr:hypothetical protein [Chloroflexaceae bacterium]